MTCSRSVVFSGTPVSFIHKTKCHDLTELLKVALKHHNPNPNPMYNNIYM